MLIDTTVLSETERRFAERQTTREDSVRLIRAEHLLQADSPERVQARKSNNRNLCASDRERHAGGVKIERAERRTKRLQANQRLLCQCRCHATRPLRTAPDTLTRNSNATCSVD